MKLIVAIVGLVLASLLVATGISWHAFRPLDAQARIELASHAIAVNTGRSLAYIVESDTGVVLIDAGSDKRAEALRDELVRRGKSLADVRAVLLTSPHPFVVAGLDAFNSVPVYAGDEDQDLVRRNTLSRPLLARACDRWMFHGKRPNPIETVLAGSIIVVDGVRFDAVAIPGVSPGARAYLTHDVAFIGPTLEHGALPSRWFAEHRDDVPRSLQRLSGLSFHWLAAATFVREDGQTAIAAVTRAVVAPR
ncbi:MAG: MBL fold metallo-hydrolase [Clostridia bacterium]|nr:MBL fold metallo-hydrolase [Deltaproteobacteria bacterium]